MLLIVLCYCMSALLIFLLCFMSLFLLHILNTISKSYVVKLTTQNNKFTKINIGKISLQCYAYDYNFITYVCKLIIFCCRFDNIRFTDRILFSIT